MFRLFSCVMLLGFLSLTWAARPATTSKKKTPVKKTATSAKKAPAKSASKTTTKRASTTTARGKAPAKKTQSWRSRQMQPTTDRYRQIQGALAAKGYLKPEEATGAWSANSVDALKRFQADQKIEGGGKINSLSLIALGLGPKRENIAIAKPAAPPPGQ
jgi:hypothetical protein